MEINHLREHLGEPYYEAPDCLIYNTDCMDGLARLPAGCIDLTLTSPPYNIGKEYESVRPLEDYLIWCEGWINEIYRVTSSNGAFWLNLGYLSISGRAKAIPIPYLLWDRIPFFLLQEIVWNYGAGVAGRKFLSPRNEKFLWYVKNELSYTFNLDDIRDPHVKYPNQKKNGKIKVNASGKNPSDVWRFPKVTSGTNRASKERTSHPAQFPLALVRRILKASSHAGQMILDPFMGSGSTGIAALELGRPVIGFEIRADYCEVASNRINHLLWNKEHLGVQKKLF